jgi:hypothetical protein
MKLYVRKLDDAHVTSFIKKGLNIPNGHPAAAVKSPINAVKFSNTIQLSPNYTLK